ncbi:DNA-binding transcriptional LysR family regulator [Pseudomonas duriflava]|uniref:DNA-binding transcriptional LysR family regulator n=1 Tax=Pseudomonas duriflava TaxID=459528 RepID=A0A562QIG3_9PSED|nr:LysR family transcriptional regulator [Pseudomonas duriflava]TWI56534.1 DNA-binding transcriptional LysR family regulator [Pseudomonas duriflava]
MDIRTLRNLQRVVRSGSLSAASDEACLTVQALAAQLNKIEGQFGFKMFQRSHKGLVLTERGRTLMPFIEQVLDAARQLEHKAADLRSATPRVLKAALNGTLPAEVNQRIIKRMIEAFGMYQLEFSCAESIENLSKLKNDNIDLAVLIGPPRDGISSLELADVQVTVVAAYYGLERDPLVSLSDKFLIRPAQECPYSVSFKRFADSGMVLGDWAHRTVYSSSETLTVSLIKQLDGIGFVSRETARTEGLSILPGFEDTLEVRLAVNNIDLSCQALDTLVSTPLQHRPQRNVRGHAYRHTEQQILTEISA